MLDMGHTMMNEDDEEEFEQFYDYSRTYINMGLEMQPKAILPQKEESKKKVRSGNESEDSWEDCDMESADDNEAIEEADENDE